MDFDASRPGRIFGITIGAIAVVLVLAGILILVFMGLSGGEREALEAKRDALRKVNARQGPLPTEQTIARWEAYRKDLKEVEGEVERFFQERDGNLEKYFPTFDRRMSGDRFRMIYQESAQALYKRSEPVLAKDPNGNPAPAEEVFAFDQWTWIPSPSEVRIAQMKFNIMEGVTDVLLDLDEKGKKAEKPEEKRLAPMLQKIRLENPEEVPETAVFASIRGTVEVLMDGRSVPELLRGLLSPGKHGLLFRLASLTVEKTTTLNVKYTEEVKPEEEPKLKPEQFLKPVRVVLGFELVDYQSKKNP